jgi:uncharacterized membrane protein (TIGR02234 family)
MIDRLASKRVVIVLVLVSASAILVSGSREWVSGSVGDVSLGAVVLHGKGSDIAPGALAAALVGLASAVALATSRGASRAIAACSALLASVLGAGVIISVLADPDRALGGLAAAGTGRSGTVAAQGLVGSWAWVGLAAMLVMGLGGLGALVGSRRWRGPSSRYDAPAASWTSQPGSAVQMGGRPESEWDKLSRGEDPTTEH